MSYNWKVSVYHIPEKHLYKLFAMCFGDDDTLYRYVLNSLNQNRMGLLDIYNASNDIINTWVEPVVISKTNSGNVGSRLELEGTLANIYYNLVCNNNTLVTSKAYKLLSDPRCNGDELLEYLGLFELRDITRGSDLSIRLENFINLVNRDCGLIPQSNIDTYFISNINDGILSTFVVRST